MGSHREHKNRKKRNGQLLCKYFKSPAVQNILREGIANVTRTRTKKLDVIALSHFYIVSLSVSISKNLIERKQKRVHTDCN